MKHYFKDGNELWEFTLDEKLPGADGYVEQGAPYIYILRTDWGDGLIFERAPDLASNVARAKQLNAGLAARVAALRPKTPTPPTSPAPPPDLRPKRSAADINALVTYVQRLVDQKTAAAEKWQFSQVLQKENQRAFINSLPADQVTAYLQHAQQPAPRPADADADWKTLMPALRTTWSQLTPSQKWSGVSNQVLNAPPVDRSKEWWIQTLFEEAYRVDTDSAYRIIDTIMSAPGILRPDMASDDKALKAKLQELVRLGYYPMDEATHALSHKRMVDESKTGRTLREGTDQAIRPALYDTGIGFRSESRTPQDILADGGLFAKVKTTNATLRARWGYDQDWFPLDPSQVYYRLGKGDNELDTLVSFASNIIDVSKFPLLEEETTQVTEVGNTWIHDTTVSIVRVHQGIDTQAMQAATEPDAFGHGEKAAFGIPKDDILAFVTIRRMWDKSKGKDSNQNLHEFGITQIQWVGANFQLVDHLDATDRSRLVAALADDDLKVSDPTGAQQHGEKALDDLVAYLKYLKKHRIQFNSDTVNYTYQTLEAGLGSRIKAAMAATKQVTTHKKAMLDKFFEILRPTQP